MGHVSLGWAQELRPGLCTAARYDFNMFSLNSDLAMGVEWQLDQNSIIKARWSDSQGLRCLLDARLNNMVFSMGLAFNKDTDKPSDPAGGAKSLSQLSAGGGSSGAGGVTRLIRSFGLQFQWFL
ncbi:Mitochondrial distribution and morphology protein 10 [Dipsacomyces acuminosporus]|nr:Mitochondrial distribution and morphology protein 10 [Dipsacomyces acuminosporus]